MMDTYIMTSDTMEAVPLVAAHRKPANQESGEHHRRNLTIFLQSRNFLEFVIRKNPVYKRCDAVEMILQSYLILVHIHHISF